MATYKVFKETALPGNLAANAIYLVAPAAHPGYLEIYVTDATGSAQRRTPTITDIQSIVTASLQGGNVVVSDITERNALTKRDGLIALVIDATGDATVALGAATYVWRASTTAWIKISEAESLDASIAWANITGKPTSSPAQIDGAVGAAHSHANMTQLSKIGEDGSGNFTYNGNLPVIAWDSTSW